MEALVGGGGGGSLAMEALIGKGGRSVGEEGCFDSDIFSLIKKKNYFVGDALSVNGFIFFFEGGFFAGEESYISCD